MAQERVVFLLGHGFEDSEFRVPYDRLRAAGVNIDIVGPKRGEELKGYRGKETAKADRGIDEVKPEDYAALVIPGGHSPDHLRADDRFVQFVKTFDRAGKPLAAVCHGPQLLITAGLVRGRTLTAWKTIQEDLRKIGANVKDEPVVQDRNWITSRNPGDLEAFSDAVLRALREPRREPAAAQPRQQAATEATVSAPHARKGEMPVEEAAEEELSGQRPSKRIDEQPGLSATGKERGGGKR